MHNRVFIVHGWDGYPEEGGFPWLKAELTKQGYQIFVPSMPDPVHPQINTWVSHLANQIGRPDENTFLLGHSIGAQTVLRYLQSLPSGSKIGGVVLLAGWLHLTPTAFANAEEKTIAQPWLDIPLDWDKIKLHTGHFAAIFSDNDPLVPLTDADIFKSQLGAKVIIESSKGHFSGTDGITQLPSAFSAIIDMSP